MPSYVNWYLQQGASSNPVWSSVFLGVKGSIKLEQQVTTTFRQYLSVTSNINNMILLEIYRHLTTFN